ncbi:MAG: TetR/AcrR family transcriptional regulator [Verrucomicrobia bacterium]|nr:TetR/AcrR family transcriptional regulator [Verrucomicrobiota bacterium]MCG2681973.1 TetR/AcrR family transcriptional regulator [Kiritimatiellia bacterium]MBU4248449.1 TetR/AcrR family transcriptional regulator [Verrucomicrobiota bacterium]MBU4292351.1 TetR/AcrR family transcriptional regulator [Verrucomicrobiota bacterium]MBU4430020.1 TetR/AcrR family transcriptional regulator [Verrucomicrobiota bacterium]
MARVDSQQKQKILDAAIRVFADQGLAGATTRMLARQAGMNSALIYYYFENKQALFADTIRAVIQRFFDSLQSQPKTFSSARDRLAFLVNSIFDHLTAHPERMRLITMAFHLHPDLFGQAVHALISRQFPYPLTVLKDGVDQRQLRPIHPLQGWWHIVGVCLFSLKLRDILPHIEAGSARVSVPDPATQRQAIIETLVQGMALTSNRKKSHSRSAHS